MTARKAVAKRGSSKSLADIQKQIAQEVAQINDQIDRVTGNKIRVKDKKFNFPDGTVDAGPIQLVILDFVSTNSYYEGRFDPNNPSSPVCFAVGKNLKEMRPSADSPSPQAELCHECPMNQFGSDGKGKACKNRRRMAVVAADDTSEDSDILVLETSPTGCKTFDKYVGHLAGKYNMIPVGMITEVSFADEDYSTLVFSQSQPNENIGIHLARRPEAAPILMAEPDFSANEPEPSKAVKKVSTRRRRA